MRLLVFAVVLLVAGVAWGQRRELFGNQSFEDNSISGWTDYDGGAILGFDANAPGLTGDWGSDSGFKLEGTWTATSNADAGARYDFSGPSTPAGIIYCNVYVKTQTGGTDEGLTVDLGHDTSAITTPMISTVFGRTSGQIAARDSTGYTDVRAFSADTEYKVTYEVDYADPNNPTVDLYIDDVLERENMIPVSVADRDLAFIAGLRVTPDAPAASAKFDQFQCESTDLLTTTEGTDSHRIGTAPQHATNAWDPVTAKPHKTLFHHDDAWWFVTWDGQADLDTGGWYVYRYYPDPGVWRSRSERITGEADHRMDAFWDGTNLFVAGASETQNRLFKLSYSSANSWWDLIASANISGAMTPTDPENPINISLTGDNQGRLWTFWHTDDGATGSLRYEVHRKSDLTTVGAADRLIDSTLDDDDLMQSVTFTDNGGEKVGVFYSDQTVPEMLFLARLTSGDPNAAWGAPETVNNTALQSDDHPDVIADHTAREVYAVWKTNQTGASDPIILFKRRDPNGTWVDQTTVWTRFGAAGADEYTRPRVTYDSRNQNIHVFATRPRDGGDIYHKQSPRDTISFSTETIVVDGDRLINNIMTPKLAVTSPELATFAIDNKGVGTHLYYDLLSLPTTFQGIQAQGVSVSEAPP